MGFRSHFIEYRVTGQPTAGHQSPNVGFSLPLISYWDFFWFLHFPSVINFLRASDFTIDHQWAFIISISSSLSSFNNIFFRQFLHFAFTGPSLGSGLFLDFFFWLLLSISSNNIFFNTFLYWLLSLRHWFSFHFLFHFIFSADGHLIIIFFFISIGHFH